jgi:tetraprenyl-beta-curcumene synthase
VRAAAKETAAAIAALIAYVATVLPRVRRELRRWRRLAEAIPDPERRRRALGALEEKRSNVEAVAVFATLAPLRRRRAVLRAIVPLQLAIDYRDVLEEAGEAGGPPDSLLTALDTGWVREVERLAGCGAIAPHLRAAVERCAEGQRRTHAAAEGDRDGLQRWAEGLPAPDGYRWWELAAGASSSVAAHALIALAPDPEASAETAARIDAAYFPPIGALTVILDDFVDRDTDREAGEHSYLAYYEGTEEVTERLAVLSRRAGEQLERLPRASRHQAILSGVAAFYSSPVPIGPGAGALAAFVRLRRRLPLRRS